MNAPKSPRGTFRWGQQAWPATAIGAAEFRRTQAKRGRGLPRRPRFGFAGAAVMNRAWWSTPQAPPAPPNRSSTAVPRCWPAWNDTLKHWNLGAGTRALLALPTSFVAGQAMIVRGVVGAWDLELIEPSSTPSWRGAKDFVALTPHQAQGWVNEGSGTTAKLLLGGGPVSQTLLGALLASGRVEEVWESYGLSEALTHVATRKLAAVADLQKPLPPSPQRDHWNQRSGLRSHSRAVAGRLPRDPRLH